MLHLRLKLFRLPEQLLLVRRWHEVVDRSESFRCWWLVRSAAFSFVANRRFLEVSLAGLGHRSAKPVTATSDSHIQGWSASCKLGCGGSGKPPAEGDRELSRGGPWARIKLSARDWAECQAVARSATLRHLFQEAESLGDGSLARHLAGTRYDAAVTAVQPNRPRGVPKDILRVVRRRASGRSVQSGVPGHQYRKRCLETGTLQHGSDREQRLHRGRDAAAARDKEYVARVRRSRQKLLALLVVCVFAPWGFAHPFAVLPPGAARSDFGARAPLNKNAHQTAEPGALRQVS